MFIDGCKKYGVSEKDLFVTLDLFEKTNPNMVRIPFVAVVNIRQYPDVYYILGLLQVVAGLQALGRQAQKKGHDTMSLFPKEADKNVREFTDEQLKASETVIGLQAGSNKGASQAGMNFGQQRQIH